MCFFSLYSQHNLYVVILAPTETIVDHKLHGSWIAKSLICKGSVMVSLCWFVIHLHFLEGKKSRVWSNCISFSCQHYCLWNGRIITDQLWAQLCQKWNQQRHGWWSEKLNINRFYSFCKLPLRFILIKYQKSIFEWIPSGHLFTSVLVLYLCKWEVVQAIWII